MTSSLATMKSTALENEHLSLQWMKISGTVKVDTRLEGSGTYVCESVQRIGANGCNGSSARIFMIFGFWGHGWNKAQKRVHKSPPCENSNRREQEQHCSIVQFRINEHRSNLKKKDIQITLFITQETMSAGLLAGIRGRDQKNEDRKGTASSTTHKIARCDRLLPVAWLVGDIVNRFAPEKFQNCYGPCQNVYHRGVSSLESGLPSCQVVKDTVKK
jgi:hypothetical protein